MALDVISAITNKVFIPVLADNVFKSNPLFILLHKKVKKLPGGASIVQPVNLVLPTTATSYSGADILPVKFEELITGAEFDWAQYAETVAITGLDDLRNNGPAGVINLLRANIEIAEANLRNKMGQHLQGDGTGNGGKDLLGLAAGVDGGANVAVYGGINRNLLTGWRANYSGNAGVGQALTLSAMGSWFENAVVDNTRPNVILTTHGCFNRYMSLLQANQRYTDTDLYNMGAPNLSYQGRPIIVDDQITSTPLHKMWMLNTNWMQLYVHQERNFRFVNFQQIYNQDAAVAKIIWAGQFVIASPRLQVQVVDIDPTLAA